MRKQVKMSVLKRILAVVIAVAVAVSMLTIPDAEVSAATGKVKSVAVTNLPAKQQIGRASCRERVSGIV